jgi:Ca-activated chloride channel family protein
MGQQPSVEDSTVRVVVTVTDSSGRPLTGLTQQQFSVSDKKTSLDITYFDSEDKPVSIAFIFDLSASTPLASRKTAAQLAAQIIRGSNTADEYAVIGLRDTPQVLCELGCSQTEIAAAWQQVTAAEIKEARKTPLYDACELALKKLETSKNSKRTLIVFSDGLDSASKLSFTKLRDALKESGVILYAIVQQKSTTLYGGSSMEGGGILEELGVVTGGKAYFPLDAKEIPAVANAIALQLRQQYTIGFKPAEPAPDNKWHSIKIKLTMPKAEKAATPNVRYREGYYSH